MQKKLWLKICLAILVLIACVFVLVEVVGEPLVAKKIRSAFQSADSKYEIGIADVDLSLFSRGLELREVQIRAKEDTVTNRPLSVAIAQISCKGVGIWKALFQTDFDINTVTISHVTARGEHALANDTLAVRLAPANVHIDHVILDNLDLEITAAGSAEHYVVKEGLLSVHDIQFGKHDTLSRHLISHFDFEAKEFQWVTPDSMYTLKTSGISYVENTQLLTIDSFMTLPNYSDYDFTARHRFQTDCIRSKVQGITAHGFSVPEFWKSKNIIADDVEIGHLDLYAFRDRRIEMRSVVKPMLQDLMRDYPGDMDVDSLRILAGDIAYKEHAEKASQAGILSFNDIQVRAGRISNDSAGVEPMEIWFKSKLMGEGTVIFKSKMDVADTRNIFSLTGSLSSMDARHLNQILERNKFIFVTSGWIDGMQFNFTAGRETSSGEMTMLYRDFEIAVKNKRTDDTTGLVARATSFIANLKIMNANPLPGKEARTGTIAGERDKEKFMFYYCLVSILSGIESTLLDRPGRRNVE